MRVAPNSISSQLNDLSSSIAKELTVSDAILDGEIVVLDGTGRPAFYDLMKRQCQVVYYAFDIIWLNERACGSCRYFSAKRFCEISSRASPLGSDV
jgi:ATP-dependent DNA ligase